MGGLNEQLKIPSNNNINNKSIYIGCKLNVTKKKINITKLYKCDKAFTRYIENILALSSPKKFY